MKLLFTLMVLLFSFCGYSQYTFSAGVNWRKESPIFQRSTNQYYFGRVERIQNKWSVACELSYLKMDRIKFLRSNSTSMVWQSKYQEFIDLRKADIDLSYFGIRLSPFWHFSQTNEINSNRKSLFLVGFMFRGDVLIDKKESNFYYHSSQIDHYKNNPLISDTVIYDIVSTDPFATYDYSKIALSIGPQLGYRIYFNHLYFEVNASVGLMLTRRFKNEIVNVYGVEGRFKRYFIETTLGVGWKFNKMTNKQS